MNEHDRCMELWKKLQSGEITPEEFEKQLGVKSDLGIETVVIKTPAPGVKVYTPKRSNPDYFQN